VSFTQMAKAKPIKVGNSGRKLVLMMLADISDDSGRCFPSYQHLADVCEMSRRSVITHISKLEEDGYLKVTHRKLKGELLNSSNIYHLILKSAANTDETCGENSALGSETVALGSENSALGGSEMVSPITYHSSYPIKEPIKKKAVALNIPEWLDADLFNDYQVMRKSIKSPMTIKASTILINKLSKHRDEGHDTSELLENAILNNWKSIYPNNKPTGGYANVSQINQQSNNSAPARVRAANAEREAQRARTERAVN